MPHRDPLLSLVARAEALYARVRASEGEPSWTLPPKPCATLEEAAREIARLERRLREVESRRGAAAVAPSGDDPPATSYDDAPNEEPQPRPSTRNVALAIAAGALAAMGLTLLVALVTRTPGAIAHALGASPAPPAPSGEPTPRSASPGEDTIDPRIDVFAMARVDARGAGTASREGDRCEVRVLIDDPRLASPPCRVTVTCPAAERAFDVGNCRLENGALRLHLEGLDLDENRLDFDEVRGDPKTRVHLRYVLPR